MTLPRQNYGKLHDPFYCSCCYCYRCFITVFRRSLVDLSRTQRVISLITRVIIVLLLILSVADVQYLKTDDKLAVMFLADISDSISDDGLTKTTDYFNEALKRARVGTSKPVLIAFTDKAEIIQALSKTEDKPDAELELAEIKKSWVDTDEDAGDTTNIAHAIETAWGFFPSEC